MNTLSIRAQKLGAGTSKLLSLFAQVQKNAYDERTNPDGICNCGVAENYLCEKELIEKLQSIQIWHRDHMFYPDSLGHKRLRQTLCRFFEKFLHLNYQLDPERMIISSGLSGIMSLIGFLLGDPNDVFLIPAPYYTAFDHDISVFAHCALFRCPVFDQTNGKFRFSVELFRHGYEQAISAGLRPRGLIIINPSNPLGDIYDEEIMQPVLKFAAEKDLHVIFDEIYAFSLFENQAFHSMLTYQSIVDPKRTHFVWSFSKDFALSGVRIGVLYTGSSEMISPAGSFNFIQVPSTIVQDVVAELLSDEQWIDSYLKMNSTRLTQRYAEVTEKIRQLDSRISIRPAHAGFFIWTDFRSILQEITFEEEQRLFDLIFEHGVYISPGVNLGCSEPGWFRFIFSVREQWIDEAMKRLKRAIDVYDHLTNSSSE